MDRFGFRKKQEKKITSDKDGQKAELSPEEAIKMGDWFIENLIKSGAEDMLDKTFTWRGESKTLNEMADEIRRRTDFGLRLAAWIMKDYKEDMEDREKLKRR